MPARTRRQKTIERATTESVKDNEEKQAEATVKVKQTRTTKKRKHADLPKTEPEEDEGPQRKRIKVTKKQNSILDDFEKSKVPKKEAEKVVPAKEASLSSRVTRRQRPQPRPEPVPDSSSDEEGDYQPVRTQKKAIAQKKAPKDKSDLKKVKKEKRKNSDSDDAFDPGDADESSAGEYDSLSSGYNDSGEASGQESSEEEQPRVKKTGKPKPGRPQASRAASSSSRVSTKKLAAESKLTTDRKSSHEDDHDALSDEGNEKDIEQDEKEKSPAQIKERPLRKAATELDAKRNQRQEKVRKFEAKKAKTADLDKTEDLSKETPSKISNSDKQNMFNTNGELAPPWFIHPDHIRDAKERRPDDPLYDPSTVLIPDLEWKKMSNGMQMYWKHKCKFFDKILMYRLGHYFFVYFKDAAISCMHCDVVGEKIMAYFHQRLLNQNISLLVDKGYKVAVCEQTENSDMMQKRIARENKEKVENITRCVQREVSQVFTKGTHFDLTTTGASSSDFGTKHVLSFCFDDGGLSKREEARVSAEKGHSLPSGEEVASKIEFGYCYFDMSTLKFTLGSFQDDFTRKQFRTLCLQTRPVEALCMSSVGEKDECVKILQNSQSPAVVSKISDDNAGHSLEELQEILQEKISKYFEKEGAAEVPAVLKQLQKSEEIGETLAAKALLLAISYLDSLLLAETSIPVSEFSWVSSLMEGACVEQETRSHMVIDAQALEHLEVLETSDRGVKKHTGTLLHYLSQNCQTAFGKRLMKRWLVRPLNDEGRIKARLQAVENLKAQPKILTSFQKNMAKIPDLERLVSKIYTYSVRSAVAAIYVDMKALNRLNEFFELLKHFKKIQEFITRIFGGKDGQGKIFAKRLRQLTTFQPVAKQGKPSRKEQAHLFGSEEDKFPNYQPLLEEFENMIEWKKSEKNRKIAEPRKGLDPEFEAADLEVNEAKQAVENYLDEIKKEFNLKKDQIFYTKTNSNRFEFQVAFKKAHLLEDADGEDHFLCTSQVKEWSFFTSSKLAKLTEGLEDKESNLKKCIIPFFRSLFTKFHQNRNVFVHAINCIAELDCLASLAVLASNTELGPMCKPLVHPPKKGQKPFIDLQEMRHPGVQMQMLEDKENGRPERDFVPNHCQLGIDGDPAFALITGPNMGGKSTFLRQCSLACIMAQVGSFVPAKKCELTLVDRVFTRIGASDRILENKSTFFIELEETKAVLEEATENSFVIMDELGRGTSTFDGYAIAHSVLRFIATKLKCRCLFTTHYHNLVANFGALEKQKVIGCFHMASDYDEETQELKFKYKFEPGVAPQSFGIHVAKMAGLDPRVIERARRREEAFRDMLNLKRK